jgi:hydroxypyruvate reductase
MPAPAEAQLLRDLFEAGVNATLPRHVVPAAMPANPGRIIVLGAGKASAAMAAAVEAHWPDRPLEGLVVTRYGHAVPCNRIEIVEAAHPVPDAAGALAARRILAMAQGAGEGDLVLALISGGGSAALTLPAPGVSLEDKQAVTRALLRSGAAIGEINCVRKHLSAIKGGRLVQAAWPASVLTLIISDVPGDDPSNVASGPTVADASTREQALKVLRRYEIDAPCAVLAHLSQPTSETPKPGDAHLARSRTLTLASAASCLEAAAALARARGITPIILGDNIEGEAREVASRMAAEALYRPTSVPLVLLSGGETSVTVRGEGRGGRNAEFLLALAVALDGAPHIHALACDTDGIDGSENNAGAIIDPTTLARARAAGLDPWRSLQNNDAYSLFEALGDLVVTGPTLTNVNDFRAILIDPPNGA